MSGPAEKDPTRSDGSDPSGRPGKRRVDLRLLGMHSGRPLVGPETLHIDVTNGCNTNCVTCWDHSPHLRLPRLSEWKRQRIDAAAVTELLGDAAELGGLRAVILSGMGEPFTHPDIYEMIAEVKRRGLHLSIITNLVPADAGRVIELGVDQLLIGMHAATEAAYRAFHPSFQSDEWSRVLAMLAQFAQAQRRFKHVHVICRTNAHELTEMVRLAARFPAEQVNFKLASLHGGTEAVRITAEQRARLADEWLPSAQREAETLGVRTNLDVLSQQLLAGEADTAPIAEVGCFMGYAYSRVLVDGTVLYCCNPEVRVGALSAGDSLSSLWDGPAWNALRDRFRRGDYLPSCGQCGKFNQNVQLSRRFAETYGEARRREVTGCAKACARADGTGGTR